MPMIGRVGLALAVVALGAVVLFAGQGGLTTVAAGIASAFTGFVDKVTATPSPSPSPVIALTAPTLDAPDEPYTNQDAVDITGSIPLQFVGQDGLVVRLYVTPKDGDRSYVAEQPVAERASFVFAGIELVEGSQLFSATLAAAEGSESDDSTPVTFVLDKSKPKITITSPKSNAIVNGTTTTIKGKTQGRSTIIARNARNGATASVTAAPDGAFEFRIAIGNGSNSVTISATDPAGNENEAKLTIRKGSGKLSATLRANRYQFARKSLPEPITLTVSVTDPDGRAVKGADVTFTLSVPGIETIVADGTTDSNGRASFKSTIPKGAATGSGTIAALVDAGELGNVTARTAITITR
jgi:hypothetical protein